MPFGSADSDPEPNRAHNKANEDCRGSTLASRKRLQNPLDGRSQVGVACGARLKEGFLQCVHLEGNCVTEWLNRLWRGSRRQGRVSAARKALYVSLAPALALVGVMTQLGTASAVTTPVNGTLAYFAVSPCRILDTRNTSPLDAGTSINVLVAPSSGTVACADGSTRAVPSGAGAAVINATVTGPTIFGYLSLYPVGGAAKVSNLNFAANETVPNLTTVGLGSMTGGSGVTVLDEQPSGQVQVVLDVEGYYATPSDTAGQYAPITPVRIADTRPGSGEPYAGQTLAPGGTLNLQVTGSGGDAIPLSGVSAVVFNLTVANGTAGSYLTAYPYGATRPTASNLNFAPGEVVPNRVIVPVGTGGKVSIYNVSGSVDVIVDADGYYTDSTASAGAGSLFTPLPTPQRIADTRSGSGSSYAGDTLSSGGSLSIMTAGVGAISSAATAVAENLTTADGTAGSYFTVYPTGATRPRASDLNFAAREIVPNMVQATLGGGSQTIYNAAGSADAIVDVFGFFAPATVTTIAVTPTTAQSVTTTGTRTYTVSATKNGSPDTTNTLGLSFQQVIGSPTTASIGQFEDVYIESGGTPTYCWEGADSTGADCPSGTTTEASGATAGGATTTFASYTGSPTADTAVGVVGTGTFFAIMGDNPSGGAAADGLGSATPEGYVDTDGGGFATFESGEPNAVGGSLTFTPVATGLAPLAVTTDYPAAADTFQDGGYYTALTSTANAEAGSAGQFGVQAAVVDQSGLDSRSTDYAVTWTITNTGSSTTHVYLTGVTNPDALSGGPGAHCTANATGNVAGAGLYDCDDNNLGGSVGHFVNPNDGTNNDTIPANADGGTGDLTIAGGASMTFTDYTFKDHCLSLSGCHQGALIFVSSDSDTTLTVSAQLAVAPGVGQIGPSIGAPESTTLNWVHTPASAGSVSGTVATWDPVAESCTEPCADGAETHDFVIVQTASLGRYMVQYDQTAGQSYTVGGTSTNEDAFESTLATSQTYSVTNYGGSSGSPPAQTNSHS